jgi:uncharacterized protein YukE
MTTISMNTDRVRGIQRKLKKLHDAIMQQIQNSNSSVSGVFSDRDWVSSSANEFNGLYSNSSSTIIGIADELEEIADQLAEEVQHWESVAERLSH